MGHDDEYKMVSSQDDVNDALLERSQAITRSSYRKRNMFASIAVGAIIGAAVMFLVSILFAPQGYKINKSAETDVDAATKVEAQKAEVQVQTQTRLATVTVTSVSAAATATVAAVNPLHLVQQDVDPAHKIENGVILDCGGNAAEARAKGCVFDVMMQDWMPAPCYDETLSERYLAAGNWTWWADPEAKKSLTLDEMRTGEHSVIYVIQDYHKSHCIYAWEKAIRALRNDWPLIEELISYDHVMHCRHSTLSKHAEEVRGVRAPTAFVRCGLYKDWQGQFPGNSVSSIEKRWESIVME